MAAGAICDLLRCSRRTAPAAAPAEAQRAGESNCDQTRQNLKNTYTIEYQVDNDDRTKHRVELLLGHAADVQSGGKLFRQLGAVCAD